MSSIIRTENVTRVLEGEVPVTLVNGATLEINKGEFIAITGPSGSGKSSLLYLLGLIDLPTSGKIFFNGQDLSGYSDDKLDDLRLADMGFVFQFHFLLPEFTLLENVMMPMLKLGKLSKSQAKAKAAQLLTDFGLADHINKLPKQLSGGQSQRVAIARALANEPNLILADEPTGNLDSASSLNVQKILKDIAHKQNKTVVVVTHEKEFAQTADRIIHIVDGKIAK